MLKNFSEVDELTKENILKRISEIDILFYYIPSANSLINKRFCSELRDDNNPTCCIIYKYNKLFYKDFGTGESYNCWSYVMKKFNVTYKECLNIISNDFNLKLGNLKENLPSMNYFGIKKKYKIKQSTKTDIRVKYRNWNNKDKEYWYDQYYITSKILKEYNVYPLSHYFINDLVFSADKLAYGYYEYKDKWKIYQPYSINKWFGNFDTNVYSGFDQLNHLGKDIIITSSLKDVMVWRILGYNAFSPQSEGQLINEDIINNIVKRFENIYINYDNDKAGIEATNKLKNRYDFMDIIYTEDCKDISDYICKYGIDKTNELIENIIKNK